MRLAGKTAIITGGGSGMGAAAAQLFASEGAEVIAVDVNEEALTDVAGSSGGAVTGMRGDVSSPDDVQRVVDAALDRWGRIDVLVNNAGITVKKPAFETTDADFDRQIDINLRSVFLFCRAVGPHMVAAGRGSIVNNASSSALFAVDRVTVYAATKGGIVAYTKNLAIELAKSGVRVNAICPHATLTPMAEAFMRSQPDYEAAMERMNALNPIGRPAQPIEVAHAMLFLASDDASVITGAVLPVDGGAAAIGASRY